MDRGEVDRLLVKVLSEPHQLIDIICASDDDAQAVDAIGRAFGVSSEHAKIVIDQQFKLLTRDRMAKRAHAQP